MISTFAYMIVLLYSRVIAGALPDNVKRFYDSVRLQSECKNKLQSGFTLSDSASDTDNSYSYCGDHPGLIYIQGSNGQLADMDVDCDGNPTSISSDDRRCDSSLDTIPATTFKPLLKKYGINDLNAYIHTYVVFGNLGSRAGFVNFNPQDYGLQPLSVMAVVCNDQLFYGIWGDTNGDDQPKAAIGEASLSLASFCFGNSVNGNSGHNSPDVLYIGFTGDDAVANESVNWGASNAADFQASLKAVGDSLVRRL